ncbi:NAD kinase 3 [Scenedesmus sp. PABB004]|nr:NAD kinase 3 [Scenedesmus sp. PABB004]
MAEPQAEAEAVLVVGPPGVGKHALIAALQPRGAPAPAKPRGDAGPRRYVLPLDTRYYTASLRLRAHSTPADARDAPGPPQDTAALQGVVLVFDAACAASFAAAAAWADAHTLDGAEVRLLVAGKADTLPRGCCDGGAESSAARPDWLRSAMDWAVERGFEYVEAAPGAPAADAALRLDGEPQGAARVRAALEAHAWPGAARKAWAPGGAAAAAQRADGAGAARDQRDAAAAAGDDGAVSGGVGGAQPRCGQRPQPETPAPAPTEQQQLAPAPPAPGSLDGLADDGDALGGELDDLDELMQQMRGLSTVLADITQELANARAEAAAARSQARHWQVEADAWRCRHEQEAARNERLRRVLRCTPGPAGLAAQPSLALSPRAASALGVGLAGPSLLRRSSSSSSGAGPGRAAALAGPARSPRSSTGAPLHRAAAPRRRLRRAARQSRSLDGSSGMQPAGAEDGGGAASPTWRQPPAPGGQPLAGRVASHALPDPFAACSSLAPGFSGTASGDVLSAVGSSSSAWDGEAAAAAAQQRREREQQLGQGGGGSAGVPSMADAVAGLELLLQEQEQQEQAASDQVPPVRRSRTLPRSFVVGGGGGMASARSWALPPPWGAAAGAHPGGSSRHTVDQLLRMMMAFTIMQGGAPGGPGGADGAADDGGEGGEDEPLPTVSLDDDDGSSGVGLAAAAAVSAAMARAWASAASKEQRAVAAAQAAAAGAGGGGPSACGGGQRAGFRLVATVTNKMGKRPPSSAALASYYSQDSLDGGAGAGGAGGGGGGGSSPDLPGMLRSSGAAPSALARAGSGGPGAADGAPGADAAAPGAGRPPLSPGGSASGGAKGLPTAGAAAAAAARGAADAAAPGTGQATAISLHWLSRPHTVLVMRKLAPSTEAAFLRALDWLRRHRITIYVEPSVYQELLASGRVVPLSGGGDGGGAKDGGGGGGGSGGGGGGELPRSGSGSGRGSSSCISGLLVSTEPQPPAQHAAQQPPQDGGGAGGQLVSACSWPAAQQPSRLGHGAGGGERGGVIKTWQPGLPSDAQRGGGGGGGGEASGVPRDLLPEAVAAQLDLVLVLGGDGTVLWTCHIFGNRSVPPLVPFNLGSLGFLTPFDPDRLEGVLARALRGGFPITLRHRLHCTIVRRSAAGAACVAAAPPPDGGSPGAAVGALPVVRRGCLGAAVYGEEHVALNEVVLERGLSPFLTNLECFCDGAFVTHVQGDGLILGTPTGSTAYSLAAGGSMVHPQVPCILFTPICPHSLSFRPLMFPDYCQLCIQVPLDARGGVWASFDGKDRTELGPGDAVVVRLSRWPVPSVAAEADPAATGSARAPPAARRRERAPGRRCRRRRRSSPPHFRRILPPRVAMGWLKEAVHEAEAEDETVLARMGYKQELSRQLSLFNCFATTFSFLSPITGLTGTYIGSSAGVAYTSALLIGDFIKAGSGGSAGAPAGVVLSQPALLGLYAAVLILIGLVNTVTVRALGVVGEISIWFHLIGCTAFVVLLPALAPTHQSAAWVFTTFAPNTAYSGIESLPLMFILSLLGCQWAMVGYDAASHLTEETHAADVSGPIAILATIGFGFLLGMAFLLSVTFSIQDPASVSGSTINPVMQIAWDVFQARFGSGLGGLGLMVVPLACSLFCGNACVTSTSRMLYAFARDGAVPLSGWWTVVSPRFEAPVNAVWCIVTCCFLLGLPLLYSYTVFAAITSIGVVGLYISYLITIGLRLLADDASFTRGPFHLGRMSKPVAGVAFAWCLFACVMFVLPQVLPVTAASLNYAPVAVGVVLLISGVYYIRARSWFDGPRKTVDEPEDPSSKDVMLPPGGGAGAKVE